jgi:hypothetical protein
LSGLAPRAAWLASLVFFALGAAANLYLVLEGQRSCGCFGRVEVNPWWTVGLDAAIVLALMGCRPLLRTVSNPTRSWSPAFKLALSTSILLVLIGGGFLLLGDDPAHALALLRGEVVEVVPAITDVGEGRAGEERTFRIEVRNHTSAPVRIVGGTTTCSCIATNDLPVTIAPRQTEYITVQVRFRGSPGRFGHRYVFYTDAAEIPWLRARFAGQVVAESER